MRRLVVAALLAALSFAVLPVIDRADAAVLVLIDRASQTMSVSVDGVQRYTWRVSTARRGYITPPGTYRPEMLARTWYSTLYYHSPMPHSIFFAGGYAIHGTYETGWLGHPASHGCVRISPENAAVLFDMVKEEGAIIHITGQPPETHYAVRHHRRPTIYAGRGWGRPAGSGYSPWGYAPQGPAWGASFYGGY